MQDSAAKRNNRPYRRHGWMAERLMALAWKASIRGNPDRRFESCSIRHKKKAKNRL